MSYCECLECADRRLCFAEHRENSHAPVWSDLYGYEVKDAVACSKCGIPKLNYQNCDESFWCRACRYLHYEEYFGPLADDDLLYDV